MKNYTCQLFVGKLLCIPNDADCAGFPKPFLAWKIRIKLTSNNAGHWGGHGGYGGGHGGYGSGHGGGDGGDGIHSGISYVDVTHWANQSDDDDCHGEHGHY